MIEVICINCQLKHHQHQRKERNDGLGTTCPRCGSFRLKYGDKPKSTEIVKQMLLEINGIHDNILNRIEDEYGSVLTVHRLQSDELEEIKGIGKKTAKRIVEKV